MNTTASLPRTIALSRPWPLRWWQAAVDALHAARALSLEARRERAAAAMQAWDPQAVVDLDDHVLRDIGAPDWVRAEAAARREAALHCAQLNSRHLFDHRGL